MIETNLATSKRCRDIPHSLKSHALSATVSIVALLMVGLSPVSVSVRHVRPLVETNQLRKVEQVVCVPVCTPFRRISALRVV